MDVEQTPNFVNKVSNEAKLKELLRNITSNELRLCKDASKEFIKLLKGDSGGELLRLYVKSSSLLSEIVQAWKARQGKSGLLYVLTLVSVILGHYEGMYRVENVDGSVSRALDKFAKMIVEEKLDGLCKMLNSKDPKQQKAVLLLLSSIVRRGSGLASDVANRFDFKLPVFPKLAEYRKRERGVKRKKVTRKAFVGFAMSFLEVGKAGLLRGVLTKREMYSGVLRGLGGDDDETVVYVLSTLRDRILKEESLVPPGLRSVLFGSVTLDQLIGISGRNDGGLAIELAQEVLSFVCTDPSNGLMPDMMRSPPLAGNLTRLLGVLKKLRATENEHHRVLLLSIVKGKPSFGSAYLDEFPYNLEDHASSNWFSAISLAADVVSSVGDGISFEFLKTQTRDSTSFRSSDVQSIIKCICPRPFTRLVTNKGLLHSNSLIKHGTLRLVFEALKLLDSFVSAVDNSSCSGSRMIPGQASLKKDIEEEVWISLPDPQVLLSFLSSLNSHYKKSKLCPKRASSSETVPEHNNRRRKKQKISNADDEADIIVGGMNPSVGASLPVDTENLDTTSFDELDKKDAHMNIIAKIWGVHHCNTTSMMVDDEYTYFYSKVLDTLKFYHRRAPTLLEGSYDFLKVLPENALALPSILQQSILSLLIEYIGWSSKSELPVRVHPLMYKRLESLLNLLLYSPAKDIKEQAFVLAKAAMSSSGAFDHNLREIGTWFLFLPGYSSDNLFLVDHWNNMRQGLFSAVITFLCEAVSTIGNSLFKEWDRLRSHIYHLTGRKDLSPDFSPLVVCILEKCLKVLRAKSKTLPEKTLISLYVSNTLTYLLQTQVESGLLSSVISRVLSESSEGVDVSLDMCEWRPLKKLSNFLESITCQQTCISSPLLPKDAILSESSLANTIKNIKSVTTRGHASELAGVTAAFSFSMVCTTPAELLQNFPSVIALSANFLGVPLPLLLSTFFSEQSLLCDISKLWPEMFFNGLQRATSATHSEDENKYVVDDIHSVECSSVAFGSLLKQAPFHVLFPALVSIECSQLLDNIKLQDLLISKLSEEMADVYICYVPLVFFWFHQIQSSYRQKTLHDLKKISELCFAVLKNLVSRILSVQMGSCSNTSRSPSPQHVQEMADILFGHPAVLASLEHPFTASQDEISGVSLEDIFGLAKQGIHTVDYHVWNLVATTSDHLFAFCNHQNSPSEFDSSYERILKAFNSLVGKLLLILKDKFDQWLKTKNVKPLVPTLYALHTLLPFISPFILLELVRYIFSRVDLNDSAVWSCYTKPALCVGLSIAGRAFDLLSGYLRDPYIKQKQFGFWGEGKVIDVCLFEEIYFHVIEIALQCELDVTELCLLKAINVAKTSKLVRDECLSLCLVVPRVIASTPNKFVSSCIHNTSMSKVKFLFILTEVSPFHMSVFGHLFSEVMAEYMLLKGKNLQACSHTLSDDGILMLLPTFLSFLNSTLIKSADRYPKALTNIVNYYWEFLSRGFSTWKDYVWRDVFLVEFGEIGSSSVVEFLSYFHDSLLGKAILMVCYYLASSGNSLKLEKRLELYNSVVHTAGAHVLLDCKVDDIDGYSNSQSVNLLCKTIAKIKYCRKLLFPEDNNIHSVFLQGKDGGKSLGVVPSEVGHVESQVQFVDKLVCAWQCLVKKFPSKMEDFGEVKGTCNSSVFRILEVFILKNILQLTSEMGKNLMKLDSLKKLVKSSLLYRFQDPTVFRMLQGVLTKTVDTEKSCDLIIKLLLAHSQFAPTIAAASKLYNNSQFGIVFKPMSSILRCYRNQNSVVVSGNSLQASDIYMNLLEVLKLLKIALQSRKRQDDKSFEEEIGINAKELVVILLSAYGATLSEIDLEIYDLLRVIESTVDVSSSYIAEINYLWGSAALKVHRERDEEQNASLEGTDGVEEAVDERRRYEFRENLPIDPKLCTNTVLYFPYDRTIGEGTFSGKLQQFDTLDIEAHSRDTDKPPIYDPVFILQFSIHNLSMGYIEPLEFASFGLLAVAFVSLSSPWEEMRKLGYEAIGRFKNALERNPKRKDVTRICLLLTYLQNGIVKSWQRIPSITAMFVAEASFILLDPSNEHYVPISKLLVGSSRVDLERIPMFDHYFWSSSVNYKSERMWILRLLYSGLNIENDAQLYIRNSIPDTLLSLYSSPLSDDESKELVIEIVVKFTKLRKMSRYLIKQCGLISWLSVIVSNYRGRQHLNKGSLSSQLIVLLQVVNDVLLCNHTIEWLQEGALEQLTELSSHLYKLLEGGIDLVQENTFLGSLILRILTSTLRISQKRDVYRPHFTLSGEGIFQIYKAAYAFSDGRYNPTAEEGLELVLMNTPPVDFLCMNREKLLKFVQWAISTAIQSDSERMLQPMESSYHNIMSLEKKEPEESLKSKLLRWFTASVIRGLLSKRLKFLNSSLLHKQSSPLTLHTLIDQIERERGEQPASFGSEETHAVAIFYLQQLLGRKCIAIPSVVSALCLIFCGILASHAGHLESLLRRIRCPYEANPAWIWSFDHQWKDDSPEPSEVQKLDENQACQSLLVVISGILGRKSSSSRYLSYEDMKNCELFKWERTIMLELEQ
ncbi:uncharacterized protein LOC141689235 isoform X2 [Apium graveolens]|uniref:uncharacterized protein LOC141689235 isoform X2 n=1 Tax=Apium graveolens TaxID=4045 RepID=UPI003D7ACE96